MSSAEDVDRFSRFASDTTNWCFGPLLELDMAFRSASDLRAAWAQLWLDPYVRGPWSDMQLTKPLDPGAGLQSPRVPAYGRMEVPGLRIFGFKAGVIHGDVVWVAVPPRMVRRAAPMCDDPDDMLAVHLHHALCMVSWRIRHRAEWCGATVASEDAGLWQTADELREMGGIVRTTVPMAERLRAMGAPVVGQP